MIQEVEGKTHDVGRRKFRVTHAIILLQQYAHLHQIVTESTNVELHQRGFAAQAQFQDIGTQPVKIWH